MTEVFICDYLRTPIGRYGGAPSGLRADDLGAVPAGEADLIIAGGVESMSRAPL